jgi:hypothetical protein
LKTILKRYILPMTPDGELLPHRNLPLILFPAPEGNKRESARSWAPENLIFLFSLAFPRRTAQLFDDFAAGCQQNDSGDTKDQANDFYIPGQLFHFFSSSSSQGIPSAVLKTDCSKPLFLPEGSPIAVKLPPYFQSCFDE